MSPGSDFSTSLMNQLATGLITFSIPRFILEARLAGGLPVDNFYQIPGFSPVLFQYF